MVLNQKAREETIRYHENYYSSHKLFKDGWLAQPDEEIANIAKFLSAIEDARALDIGCGVGRNAIALAQAIRSFGGRVFACDMLASAIEQLVGYAQEMGVSDSVVGSCADMDALEIDPSFYDAIMAISVIEHSGSVEGVRRLLRQMIGGTRPGGVNRVTVSTDRRVTACDTGEDVPTGVETPMSKEIVVSMLREEYSGWRFEKLSLVPYKERLEYNGRQVVWTCTDVSFLAFKSK